MTQAMDVQGRLRRGERALDASRVSDLGRLGDLDLRLETTTAEEVRSGGAGWTIRAGYAKTPFGVCLLAEGPRGICHLSFPLLKGWSRAAAAVREDWPHARVLRSDALARRWATRIFRNRFRRGTRAVLRLCPRGSAFQARVWRAWLRVPAGALVSYGRLAKAAGVPKAARATGSAVARNPLAWLIPCHRVIREDGALGNYHWGPARKRAMLVWEAAHRDGALRDDAFRPGSKSSAGF